MDKGWIIEDFAAALDRLEEALRAPAESDLMRSGTIQYFEFCSELAWKSIRLCAEDAGLPPCLSPKACLQVAFSQGGIDEERLWLDMLEARNRMTHAYSAASPLLIYTRIGGYLPPLKSLLEKTKTL